MARLIGLAKLAYDPDLLGWHPTIHQQVIDAGGEWAMHAYWDGGNPTNTADVTGMDYDIVVTIDGVSKPEELKGFKSLNLYIEKHSDLLARLKLVKIADLPVELKSSLEISGIVMPTKEDATLHNALRLIVR